jgi:exonuclease SbcC
MKILKLKALNINSLKGEVNIDFTTFLNDNALFAITGPTGAGKSTILDIITCALYGRTARLKNPNDLMARHTGECYCEVEFEIKGDIYRSSWTQKRARKSAQGKFQTAKMELSDVKTSKVIKATLRDVPKYVEELSGLDFDRFIQSMMLAQGGFDAFLKAKEADRSELLEKITGTQIYNKISKEIYDTYFTSKSDIDTHTKLLDSIELIDSKDLEEKTKALEENKKQKEQYDKKEKELIQIKTWLETLSKLELDSKNYTYEFDTISKEKEAKKEEFKALDLANKALNVQTIYEKQNTLQADIKQDESTYTKLQVELQDLKEKLVMSTKLFEENKKELVIQKENFDTETAKIKDLRTLNTQINETQKNLNTLELKIASKKEEIESIEKTKALIDKEFKNIQEELNTTKNYLLKNKTDESLIEKLPLIQKNIKELEQENTSLKELLSNKEHISKKEQEQKAIYLIKEQEVKELKAIYEIEENKYKTIEQNSSEDTQKEQDLRTSSKKIESLLSSLKEYEEVIKKIKEEKLSYELNSKDKEHLNTTIKTKHSLVEELSKHIETLREKREHELLIKKYEDDRVKLQKGEECYLCGSKEHPFIEKHIEEHTDKTSSLIVEKEQELKVYEEEVKSLSSKLNKAEQRCESSTLELEKLEKQKETITKLFQDESIELNENTKVKLEEELEEIYENLNSIIKRREEKEKVLKQRDISNQNFTSKQKEFMEYEKQINQTISTKEQILKDELQTDEKINLHIEQLSSAYKVYELAFDINTYKDIATQLENRKTTYQTKQAQSKENQTKENQTKINKKENETKLLSLTQELKTDKQNKDEYISSISNLKTKSKTILDIEDINLYENKVNSTLKQIQDKHNKQSQEHTVLKTKDEEVQKQEQNLKEKLSSSKQILEILKTKVQNELKNNDFESLDSFKQARLSQEQREELSKSCKTIEDKYKEYKTLKTKTSKALEEHKKQDIKIEPIAEVIQELQELQSKIDELLQSIGATVQILKRNEEDRAKHQEKILQLEKKKEEFKVWVKLQDMIGSADGNKFAKFAQGITLDQLISLANNHLSVLSSRYELQRSVEQKQILEIEVIDSFQGNVIRPVSTLSGGESFIVSLALALGLSELASQKISIDSLFLDEGFGTLDENSLEQALNALNLLQSSGKMVGVISHVEALKERIPLQIKVVPKGDGTSFVNFN